MRPNQAFKTDTQLQGAARRRGKSCTSLRLAVGVRITSALELT